MGKLIIDGNSVYEIDEECVKRRRLPKDCGVYEKLREAQERETRERETQKREAQEWEARERETRERDREFRP